MDAELIEHPVEINDLANAVAADEPIQWWITLGLLNLTLACKSTAKRAEEILLSNVNVAGVHNMAEDRGGKKTLTVLVACPELSEWLDCPMWQGLGGGDGAPNGVNRVKVPGGWVVCTSQGQTLVGIPGSSTVKVVSEVVAKAAGSILRPGDPGFGVQDFEVLRNGSSPGRARRR